MIWSTAETLSRPEMADLQLTRLQQSVQRAYDKVPFYRQKMDELGIGPASIRTLEDISLLPFTVKNDLRDNYPTGLFAAPSRDIVRFHASSGTTAFLLQ